MVHIKCERLCCNLTPVQLQGWLLRAVVRGNICQRLPLKRALGCNADALRLLSHTCCGALHSSTDHCREQAASTGRPPSQTDALPQ